jgi:hypothetical protein
MTDRKPRFLITTIPQADGGSRELYARTEPEARAAQRAIAAEPAMLDAIRVAEYVDVDRDGSRRRYPQ